jgi:signal transduction histidine kinase
METAALTNVLLDDERRRARAKERFYVICQTAGWGLYLLLNLFLVLVVPDKLSNPGLHDLASRLAITAWVILLGWLISHVARNVVARWNWKTLGWKALTPRILAVSFVSSAAWSVVGYAYPYLVLCLPSDERSIPLWVSFMLSVIFGAIMYGTWWCIYFFYHLFDRYNRLQIDQLSLATHAKEAELRALKSQVNPHFIFNSLNSLRALIEEDPLRARQAVTQLANLLRYSLQSGQLETVPFEDELSVVNDYLALEQVRHEERLRLRLDVAADTLQLPIPPMLLQTLVENAVKYGISTRPEGGEIAIIARRENDSLRLQVTNPGAFEGGSVPVAKASGSTGMGLANAASRLRLLFGEQATLQLRAGEPGSVVAEAIIPLPVSHA